MGKMMPKMAVILDFWEFFVYKIPKKQNLKKIGPQICISRIFKDLFCMAARLL